MCGDEPGRMLEGSKEAATLKPREATAVRTRGTDDRLVLEERRERAAV